MLVARRPSAPFGGRSSDTGHTSRFCHGDYEHGARFLGVLLRRALGELTSIARAGARRDQRSARRPSGKGSGPAHRNSPSQTIKLTHLFAPTGLPLRLALRGLLHHAHPSRKVHRQPHPRGHIQDAPHRGRRSEWRRSASYWCVLFVRSGLTGGTQLDASVNECCCNPLAPSQPT